MEDNQAKCEDAGRSNVCVSYHALSEDWSEVADRTINMLEKIIENEAVHAMLAVLTDKQRDLIHQQFVLGKETLQTAPHGSRRSIPSADFRFGFAAWPAA